MLFSTFSKQSHLQTKILTEVLVTASHFWHNVVSHKYYTYPYVSFYILKISNTITYKLLAHKEHKHTHWTIYRNLTVNNTQKI